MDRVMTTAYSHRHSRTPNQWIASDVVTPLDHVPSFQCRRTRHCGARIGLRHPLIWGAAPDVGIESYDLIEDRGVVSSLLGGVDESGQILREALTAKPPLSRHAEV
jgi:hypothetical protein